MKKYINRIVAFLSILGIVVAGAVTGYGQEFEGENVRIGVTSDIEEEVFQLVADKAKEDGIQIDITLFTDYVQPNEALASGSIDLNAFQHTAYLDEWNEANDGDIVPLGFTYVTSLGLYSDKIDDIESLEKGATIAIANDPTNCGRALLALQAADLIKVDDEAGILPTVEDITDNPKELKFEELDAAQLATVLPDVDAAFVNNNFANDAGLSIEEAIYRDGEDIEALNDAYKNIIAVKEDRKDEAVLKHILELYQTEEVEAKIKELSDGGDYAAWEK